MLRKGPIALLALVLIVFVALALFRVGGEPAVRIEPGLPGIGKRTPVTVRLEEPGRGLGRVRVTFVQGEREEVLAEADHVPRPFWAFWGPRDATATLELEVGRETLDGLREGEATIRVVAERAGTLVRRPDPVVVELTLEVRLRPPSLEVRSTSVFVDQGGCEAVAYRVGERSVRDGVRAGERWFPGYPLPGGGENERFALFGVPHDVSDASAVRLVAVDDVGNEATAAFVDRFRQRTFPADRIRLGDEFMARVVPAILSRTPEIEDRDDLLANYLAINGDLRRSNARTLDELAGRSTPEFLWKRPFRQMPNTKVMSTFAAHRSYVYDGEVVDRQVHLGYDLASVKAAPVPAANDGIVVMADFLGIYGNTVVLDHGYGLMTLYGHLSSIEVSEGQEVGIGETVGRTGATGLAGGDHLHYAVLLHGTPVNPVEWWDGHWIRDRIAAKLGGAAPIGS